MGRTKKVRTETELIAMLDAAEKRRMDAERRAQDARKSAADARKRLEELRAAERRRRMTVLLGELSQLGFPLDSDDDIQRIVEKIRNPETEYDETELRVLRSIRVLMESVSHKSIRSAEDIRMLDDVLHQPREIRRSTRRTAISELIQRGYEMAAAEQQPADTDTAG